MKEPVLTKQDRDSAVWQKIAKHIEARIARLRSDNDGDLTNDQTQKVRGRIAELKELQEIGAEPKLLPDENEHFKD